jgi:hypothetical protein
LEAHVEVHRLRECHICGKQFRRKQNADIHLLGVHQMSKDDLEKLGRWNPKKDLEACPEYMTRKVNRKGKGAAPGGGGGGSGRSVVVGMGAAEDEEEDDDEDSVDYIVVGEVNDEDE